MPVPNCTRRRLGRFVVLVLLGIVGVELINSARLYSGATADRHFPEQYVTKGIWTPWGLIRPPHARGADFVAPLRAARRLLNRDPDLYAGFSSRGWHYLYPPTATVVLAPIGWIAEKAGEDTASQCFDIFSRLIAAGMAVATLALLGGVIRSRRDWLIGLLVVAAFFPIRWGICCVNAQVLINALLVGAILAYAVSRPVACGLFLGLACALKPQLSVVILFIVVRREWRAGVTALATIAVLTLVVGLTIGTAPWLSYIHDVLPLASAGYAAYGNQSLLAAVRRWFGEPSEICLVPVAPMVRVIWMSASALLVAAALMTRGSGAGRRGPAKAINASAEPTPTLASAATLYRAGDMSIACFVSLMVSPISWDHHYGWTVAAFGVSLAAAVRLGLPAWYYLLIGACYVLTGTDWTPLATDRPGPISLLDSPKLLSVVVMSVVLWAICQRLSREPDAPAAPKENADPQVRRHHVATTSADIEA